MEMCICPYYKQLPNLFLHCIATDPVTGGSTAAHLLQLRRDLGEHAEFGNTQIAHDVAVGDRLHLLEGAEPAFPAGEPQGFQGSVAGDGHHA